MSKKEQVPENKVKDYKNEYTEEKECFVIMPIGDQIGYDKGHFKSVYEDIFKKAIEDAGFKPYRADDSQSSNVIHIEIIKRLIEAPMAICDLSAKNPNVMYELGIRQAFDKPVLLVSDNNPGEIFDIGNINTYQYKKTLVYREVLEDQKTITKMIRETYEQKKDDKTYNSLISLIRMNAATLNTSTGIDDSDMVKAIYKELISLKSDVNRLKTDKSYMENKEIIEDINNISKEFEIIKALYYENPKIKLANLKMLLAQCEKMRRNKIINEKDLTEITELRDNIDEYLKKQRYMEEILE